MSILDILHSHVSANGDRCVDAVDEGWKKSLPSIHEFLTVTFFNGKDRTPGKLQITTELGMWRLSIIDNAMKAMLSVEAKDLKSGLAALEIKASSQNAEWHRWGKAKAARGGK